MRPGVHITMHLLPLPRSRYPPQDHISAVYGPHSYPGSLGAYYPCYPPMPPPVQQSYTVSSGLRRSPSMEYLQPMSFPGDRRRSHQTSRPHHPLHKSFSSQRHGERRSRYQSPYGSETDEDSGLGTQPPKRKPVPGTVPGLKASEKQEETAGNSRTAANMSANRERPKEQVVGMGYATPPESFP
jgi:hypothetical protein